MEPWPARSDRVTRMCSAFADNDLPKEAFDRRHRSLSVALLGASGAPSPCARSHCEGEVIGRSYRRLASDGSRAQVRAVTPSARSTCFWTLLVGVFGSSSRNSI